MDKTEKIINITLKLVIILAVIFFVKNDMEKAQNGRFVLVNGSNGATVTAYIIDTRTGTASGSIMEKIIWTVPNPVNQSQKDTK